MAAARMTPLDRCPLWLVRMLALAMLATLAVLIAQDRVGVPASKSIEIGLAAGKGVKREGAAVRWLIPARYRGERTETRGVVLEDGAPLPIHAPAVRHVVEQGGGRYRARGSSLFFSASDATHPLDNGRRYELRLPRAVRPGVMPAAVVAAVLATALWVRRERRGPAAAGGAGVGRRLPRWLPTAVVALASVVVSACAWFAHREFGDGFLMVKGMPYSDALGWHELAISLKEGRGFTGDFSRHRPFYALFMGAVYTFFGDALWVARATNVVLIAVAALLLVRMARALAGWLLGGAVLLFCLTDRELHEMVVLTMTENVGYAFGVVAFYLLWLACSSPRPRVWWFVLAGLFFGMANLSRPLTLLAAPGFAVVMFAQMPRWSLRQVIGWGAALAAGAALVIGPWSVRQKMVVDTWSPSVNSSILMYAAAAPEVGHTLALNAGHYHEAQRAGLEEHSAEWHEFYKQRYRDAVGDDPRRYARILARSLGDFFATFSFARPESRALLVVFAIAVVVAVALRERCARLLLLVPAAVWVEPWLTSLPSGILLLAAVLLPRWRPGSPQLVFSQLVLAVVCGAAALGALVANFGLNRAEPLVSWLFFLPVALAITCVVESAAAWLPGARRGGAAAALGGRVPDSALWGAGVRVPVYGLLVLTVAGMAAMGVRTAVARDRDRTRIELPEPLRAEVLDWFAGARPGEAVGGAGRVVVEPVSLTGYGLTLRAGEDANHWAPEFDVRNYPRAIVQVRVGMEKGRDHALRLVQFAGVTHDELAARPRRERYVLVARSGARGADRSLDALALVPFQPDTGALGYDAAEHFAAARGGARGEGE